MNPMEMPKTLDLLSIVAKNPGDVNFDDVGIPAAALMIPMLLKIEVFKLQRRPWYVNLWRWATWSKKARVSRLPVAPGPRFDDFREHLERTGDPTDSSEPVQHEDFAMFNRL